VEQELPRIVRRRGAHFEVKTRCVLNESGLRDTETLMNTVRRRFGELGLISIAEHADDLDAGGFRILDRPPHLPDAPSASKAALFIGRAPLGPAIQPKLVSAQQTTSVLIRVCS
jgi:hypothetical protein